MRKIFIVEDEVKLREELCSILERNGYETLVSDNFKEIVPIILKTQADLVLLDINLPVYDGYYICRELRAKCQIPVIVVTSRNSDLDEVMSLSIGADDFITKPYNLNVLLARINSVLKRTYDDKPTVLLTHAGLTLDVLKAKVSSQSSSIELTKNELGILKLLIDNKGNIIPRNELIRHLWEMDDFVEDSTLTVNINRLRKKLEEIGLPDYIVTKRGQGYLV